MALEKLEHIGIAVKDLEESKALFTKLLGVEPYKEEAVESEGVSTLFFQLGETKIELLQGLNEESPISKFVAKKGPGIHHLAYAVENVEEEQKRLVAEGFQPLQEAPRKGADNKWVAFFHPKTTDGVLTEICADRKEE